ncbi:MAG: hypothetical protein KGI54_08435 [Pseudomonadota bacterium]|nr:hypothetical protein [Pseudomonadota bacterium]
MAKEKKEVIKGLTPVGTAVYPYLNKPDDVGGKGRPKYKVNLRLSPEESQALIESLEPHAEAAYEQALAELRDKATNGKDGKAKASAKKAIEALQKHLPWVEDVDAEGEPTGDYLFKFASNAEYEKDGKVHKVNIPLFNGKNITKVLVGGGSLLKVAYVVVPFYMPATNTAGITLRIDAIQVKKPVAPGAGGRTAEAYGFDEEDEGFDEGDFAEDDDSVSSSDTGSDTHGSTNSKEDEDF